MSEDLDLGTHIPHYFEWVPNWYWLLSAASSAASAYHGYKRNDSIGWAVAWGILGGMLPVLVPAIGYAQGFGERAK